MVDCIIGGSPCQDLSLAGKRAGLAGARSGLYMEQIRIIKEMREADAARGNTDVDIRPRYMVWENVPGAFSTNQGKDFAAVLEEAIRVAEPETPDVPVPEKGWPTSGCIMGDSWSVAWRVLDAQFWGVPQRRRRIALVADFGGLSAPEILFVRKSVSGNLEPGEPKRKETARDVGEGPRSTDNGVKCLTPWDTQTRRVYDAQFKYPSLETVCMDVGFFNSFQGQSPTLLARGYKDPHLVCGIKHIVRRLTPLECERLQGFPDGWTDIGEWVDSKGKKHKEADSPRYKALGNSIALPPWKWVLKRLCACYERDATMASLFDGIGGFPLIWEQLNGKGSCLWSSEIEEFPMAVTKLRFGGNDNENNA